MNSNQVLNGRLLPVPHAAVCPQSTQATSAPPLAPSGPEEEATVEENGSKGPAVVTPPPEQPKTVSASFGWHSPWCNTELKVPGQTALAICDLKALRAGVVPRHNASLHRCKSAQLCAQRAGSPSPADRVVQRHRAQPCRMCRRHCSLEGPAPLHRISKLPPARLRLHS